MAETFQFRLVTPTGVVFEGPVEQATAVGPLGEFGVLALHTNFITSLVPGVLTIKKGDGSFDEYLLAGGLVEVKDGAMTVLALEATRPESVDRVAATSEVIAAEEHLKNMSSFDSGYAEAEQVLRLARARAQIDQLRRAPH